MHTRSVIGELSQGKQTQFTGPRLCLQVTYPDRHFMQIVDPIPEEDPIPRASNPAQFSRLLSGKVGSIMISRCFFLRVNVIFTKIKNPRISDIFPVQ